MRDPSRLRTSTLQTSVIVVGLAMFSPAQAEDGRRAACERFPRELGTAQQLACLNQWKRAKHANPTMLSRVDALLSTSDGTLEHRVIAAALDVLRAHREQAQSARETLGALLRHRARIYQGRDKGLALRLRAYLFVVLSEVGYPDSALPMLVDTLAHVDERSNALELAAAMRAAGALGERGRAFIPYLLGSFGEPFAEEEFSLERYEPEFPDAETTTVQREAVRALGRLLTPRDTEPVALLDRIARSNHQSSVDPRLRDEARRALDSILERSEAK